jgi:hypothetical protein
MQGARLPIQQNALSLRQKVDQHDRHTFNSEQGLRSIRRRFFVVTEKMDFVNCSCPHNNPSHKQKLNTFLQLFPQEVSQEKAMAA